MKLETAETGPLDSPSVTPALGKHEECDVLPRLSRRRTLASRPDILLWPGSAVPVVHKLQDPLRPGR